MLAFRHVGMVITMLKLKLNIRIGNNCDLSDFDFESDMDVAKQSGLSPLTVSETSDRLGFSHAVVSRVYGERSK